MADPDTASTSASATAPRILLKNGNARKGGRFSSSLTVEEKLKIIEESKQAGFSVERAAAEYGVSKPTVYRILQSSSESSSAIKKYRKKKLEQPSEPFETFETMTERERLILEDYTRPDFEQRLRAVKSMAAPKETPNITIINHCFTGWPKAHNASNSLSEEGSATTIEVPPPPYYKSREAVKKLLTQSDALRELTEKEKEVVKDYTESDLNLKEMSNKHQISKATIHRIIQKGLKNIPKNPVAQTDLMKSFVVDEEETIQWKPSQPPLITVKDPAVNTVKFQKSPGDQMRDIGSVFEEKDVTLACRSVGSDSDTSLQFVKLKTSSLLLSVASPLLKSIFHDVVKSTDEPLVVIFPDFDSTDVWGLLEYMQEGVCHCDSLAERDSLLDLVQTLEVSQGQTLIPSKPSQLAATETLDHCDYTTRTVDKMIKDEIPSIQRTSPLPPKSEQIFDNTEYSVEDARDKIHDFLFDFRQLQPDPSHMEGKLGWDGKPLIKNASLNQENLSKATSQQRKASLKKPKRPFTVVPNNERDRQILEDYKNCSDTRKFAVEAAAKYKLNSKTIYRILRDARSSKKILLSMSDKEKQICEEYRQPKSKSEEIVAKYEISKATLYRILAKGDEVEEERKQLKLSKNKKTMEKYIESGGRPCPYCGKKFTSYGSFGNHVAACKRTAENRELHCDQCDFKTVHANNLRSHRARFHNTEGLNFQCTECPNKFRRQCDLDLHIRRTHTNDPVQCELCGATLRNRTVLPQHLRNAHNEAVKERNRENKRRRRALGFKD